MGLMRSRRRGQIPPFRLLFWTVVVLVGAIALLDRYPVTLDAGDPEMPGRSATLTARGDLLVVLSEAEIVRASSSGRFAASWAWVDLVRSEIGPVSVVDIDTLDAEMLQSHRIVLMTASATATSRADGLVDELEAFATGGGILALELPAGRLRTAFAADGGGGWRTPSSITAVEGVPEDVAATVRDVPLMTRFMGSTRPLEQATTLLAMDGAPVIYARDRGDGQVVVFDFDLGAQLAAVQQGLAGPDGRVRPRRSGEPIRTWDLVATSQLMGTDVPSADLLERYVAHAVLGAREPVFALWPWPDAGRGALLTSHDARDVTGRPLWMSIHERDTGARSTTFVGAPTDEPPDDHVIDDEEFVGHAALLWVLDPDDADLHRGWGLFGIEPVRRPLTLVGQLDHLETWLGDDADIRGVRIRDGRWTESFTAPWRIMDAVELRYSVTYGPAPGSPPGYLFGTCQPFTPLDVNGLPFRVQEVPVCFRDPRTEAERELLEQALERAAAEAWSVHLLTGSDRFRDAPDMDGFDAWASALRFAESNDMWIGGAGELVRFWRERSAAELRVIGRNVDARDSEGRPRAVEYTVEVETSGRGLTLMVPSRIGELELARATRGTRQAQYTSMADAVTTEEVPWLGETIHLIPLNPGFTTVGLRYTR